MADGLNNPPVLPISTIYNLKPSNTARLRSAMARTDRNCRIACIGPSTTAGQSTGGGTTQSVISWPMRAAAALQAQGINAGANNFFGDKGSWGLAQTIANFLTGESRITVTGATALGSGKTVGGNAFSMTAASTLAFTPPGGVTKFLLWWRDNGTGRQFNASVDGGTATLVSSTGATVPQSTVISAGTVGTHTLTETWVAGGVVPIGIEAYDDTNNRREISFLNWGISGAVSARFIDNTDTAGGQMAMLTATAPAAAILDDLVINDWRTSVPIATAKANVTTLVQTVKTAGGDPILTTPLWDSGTSGLSAQQDAYASMIYDVANEQDVPLIDVRAAWVSYANANGLGWYSDSVHPLPLGYNVKANTIAEFIRRVRAI